FDVAVAVAANQGHEMVHLGGSRPSHGVCEPDAIDAGSVDGAVDAHQVLGIRSERVLGAEARLAARAADLADHRRADLDDLVDAHAMRDGPESGRRGDQDIDTVNPCVDCESCVVEIAANMSEQTESPLSAC